MCRITRAAAVIRPMLQGQRLTLRNALKVVLSSEFPRSPMARTALWARLNCWCTSVQARFFGFLNATVDRGGFAFVAQIAQHPQVVVGPRGQQRQDLAVCAQG